MYGGVLKKEEYVHTPVTIRNMTAWEKHHYDYSLNWEEMKKVEKIKKCTPIYISWKLDEYR